MLAGAFKRFTTCLIVVLALGLACAAQYSSNVQGTVEDQNGAVIAGAKLTLRHTETNVTYTAKTNQTGFYRFSAIAPGRYELVAEATGFEKKKVSLSVSTNETAPGSLVLQVAGHNEQVTVSSEIEGVNPEETRLQYTLPANQITNLPVMNRSIYNLINVAPGVSGVNGDDSGSTNGGDNFFGNSRPKIHANGRPDTANLYTVDGVPIMSNITQGDVNFSPTPDMVQEISFQATTFSVENGPASSMQTELTTKSGTNDIHGDIDYTLTSRGLAAQRYNSAKTQPFRRAYTAGAFGAPIVKDHTFFFGSFELKDSMMSSTGLQTYLAPEFGSWAASHFTTGAAKFLGANPPDRMQFSRVVNTMQDVMADDCKNYAGQNICSMPVFDEGFSKQTPRSTGHQFNTRIDQYFSQKDRVYLNFFRYDQSTDYLSYDRPGFDTTTPSNSWHISSNYTHQFTDKMLNFASVSLNRTTFSFKAGQYSLAPQGAMILGPSWMGLSAPWGPENQKQHSLNFRDYIAYMKGNHNLKFGGQLWRRDYWDDSSGKLARPSVVLYLSPMDFVNDNPMMEYLWTLDAKTGAFQPQIYGAATTQFGLYLQDEWKVRPNLLISYGIRWDDFGNPSKAGEGALPFAAVFPGSGSSIMERFPETSAHIVSNAFASRQNKNFMPRVGFNWSPRKEGKLSIRGGVGLYMDSVTPSQVTANLPTNPPNRMSLWMAWWQPIQPLRNNWGTDPNRAPFGFSYPDLGTLTLDKYGAVVGYPASLNGIDRNLVPQKTMTWSFGFEQELPAKMTVGMTYSGSNSWDQYYQVDYNNRPNSGVLGSLAPQWGEINYMANGARANYNALITTVRQNTKSFNWQASYTWSHTMDNQGNSGSNTNINNLLLWASPYDINKLYASSEYDVRQRLAVSGTYQLPGIKKNEFLHQVTGGWQIGFISTYQSGTPFTVLDRSTDYNNNGRTGDNADDFPVISGVPFSGFARDDYRTGNGIFRNYQSGFSAPATHENGTFLRNAFRNPNYFTVDTSISKRFDLPWLRDRKSSLLFGADITNVLNHVNFGPVESNYSDSNFGTSRNAFFPRYIQLHARFEF